MHPRSPNAQPYQGHMNPRAGSCLCCRPMASTPSITVIITFANSATSRLRIARYTPFALACALRTSRATPTVAALMSRSSR